MKNTEIISAVNALAKIPINKIKDNRLKFNLIFNYRKLRKLAREADEARVDIIQKFQDDWRDEVPVIQALRAEGKPFQGHEEFLRSEADANKQIDALFAEDVPVEGLVKVRMEDFLKGIPDAPLTFDDVYALDCIIDK